MKPYINLHVMGFINPDLTVRVSLYTLHDDKAAVIYAGCDLSCFSKNNKLYSVSIMFSSKNAWNGTLEISVHSESP